MEKYTTPKELLEVLALRSAGYTVAAIAEHVGLSSRTVYRHLEAHPAKKGSIKQELIDNAKKNLIALVKDDEVIREKMAAIIADDLAISQQLRAVILETSAMLKPTNLEEAALVARSVTALATALKATSDTTRHSLSTKKLSEQTEGIPTLEITGITDEEAIAMHRDKMMATIDADMGDEAEDEGED